MLKYKFRQTILWGIRTFFSILPRNSRIWVFGAWNGMQYSDNAKSLFEYINRNNLPVCTVWLTKSKDVLRTVRSLNYKCFFYHSLGGIYYTYRAGVAFETEGEGDISDFFDRRRCTVIQLWHGMGYKAMKWDNNAISKQQERFSSYYWMAPSQYYVDLFVQLLQISPEKFYLTGYPRNDTFVIKPVNRNMEQLKEKHPDAWFIIYMPTHRNFGRDGNKHINIEALHEVDRKLRDGNVIMVYKPHVHELKNFLQYEDTFTNIILAKEEAVWADVYSYLHYFDLLISDYSSVITDFMCSGKPVVFFPYDEQEYIVEAGLNDCFYEFPGGPKCYSWDEVLEQTFALLQKDTWKEEREHCRMCYHQFNDGKNCERVYQTVLKILEAEKLKKEEQKK